MSLGPHPHPRYVARVTVDLDVEYGAPDAEAAGARLDAVVALVPERVVGLVTSRGRYLLGRPAITFVTAFAEKPREMHP